MEFKFGYRAKLAVILATAAIFKTHAQSMMALNQNQDTVKVTSALVVSPENKNDSVPTANFPVSQNVQKKEWKDTDEGKRVLEVWQNLVDGNVNLKETANNQIEQLQQICQMDRRVVSLAAGLQDYEMDGEDMLLANADTMSVELEKSARQEATGFGGECYKWIKHILMGLNPLALLEGTHACEGADGLRESPNFVELQTEFEHMDKIIPGGVAVFGRGPGAYSGHILIGGVGSQNEVKEYITPEGKHYQYHPASDISDKYRNANTSGKRGRVGRYATRPELFFTKNSTLGLPTLLKVGINYVRKHTSKMFFNVTDVKEALDTIFNKSWQQYADKMAQAQKIDGFKPAENQMAYHEYPATRVNKPIPKKRGSRGVGKRSRSRGGRA